MNTIDEIFELYRTYGSQPYGEAVTIAEHCLQTAAIAKSQGANKKLIAAALLHDVGHLIQEADDEYGYHQHDQSGGDYLQPRFGPAISEPVRMHVTAKRYLCAVEPEYFDCLSPASVYTLSKQGGPMSEEEAQEFAANPHVEDAVRLRRWDDMGKQDGLEVAPLESYRELLEGLLIDGE